MNKTTVQHESLLRHLRISVIATLATAVIVCGVYPLIVWGLGQLLFGDKANGSLMVDGKTGQVIGSRLIAQGFKADKYFHPRPSQNNYDPTNTGGSNLGPMSKTLIDAIQARVAAYAVENHIAPTNIPADAVTASGSGLDPHISVENANIQARRVAKARGWSTQNMDKINDLIKQNTDGRWMGIIGEEGVNVMTLNRALDQATP